MMVAGMQLSCGLVPGGSMTCPHMLQGSPPSYCRRQEPAHGDRGSSRSRSTTLLRVPGGAAAGSSTLRRAAERQGMLRGIADGNKINDLQLQAAAGHTQSELKHSEGSACSRGVQQQPAHVVVVSTRGACFLSDTFLLHLQPSCCVEES